MLGAPAGVRAGWALHQAAVLSAPAPCAPRLSVSVTDPGAREDPADSSL